MLNPLVAFTGVEEKERAMAVEAFVQVTTYRDVIMVSEAPYGLVLSRNGARARKCTTTVGLSGLPGSDHFAELLAE